MSHNCSSIILLIESTYRKYRVLESDDCVLVLTDATSFY